MIMGAAVAVFIYGAAVHLGQLAPGGWPPYRGLPGWLAGYFVSLTVLDPVAAALLACRRRTGCSWAAQSCCRTPQATAMRIMPSTLGRASLRAGPGRLSSRCLR